MEISTSSFFKKCAVVAAFALGTIQHAVAQTPAFPGALGFGRFAKGARAAASREVYIVTNLNDSGTGSFRDAVSKPGRVVVFAVGGIVNLLSDVVVSANTTIAGQTAPGDGIVFFNKRITFTGANDVICRYLRIRLGATSNSGKDASGLANGANMLFDHMSFTWGMDEVFSINWDSKGTSPDNITVQNSIIGQGLHRENHSAGGLIQTPDGGRVSLVQNLYISNKTRNPKVKGVNEFVNNVVYDWGNGNRLGDNLNYGWQGDAYIMGGSSGVSEVNVINNYFVGGPLTPPSKTTPFSRGTGTFNIYGAGNYFDNNKNGVLDGSEVPFDSVGYPGITGEAFKAQPFNYPNAAPSMSAAQAYEYIINHVGASYPRRDQVDALLVDEVNSRGTKGLYVYTEKDLPFSNGGLGDVYGAPSPLDTDKDGIPDVWEDQHGLDKNNKADAVAFSAADPQYLNIEIYINSLTDTPPPDFVRPPSNVTLAATSQESPAPTSSVLIKWNDNSTDENHFIIERSADGVTYANIAQPAANSTSYIDSTGLSPNKTYYYRIKSVSGTESSAYSNPVSVLTPTIASAPVTPTNPVPTNGNQYATPSGNKLTLKWSGSSNTLKYTLYLGTDTAGLALQSELAYSASPSFIASVADNTTYFWRVDATNAKGTVKGQLWSFRTPPVLPAGLVGHYAFDEVSADETSVVDSSSYQNDGLLGLDPEKESIRITGKLKGALDFSSAATDMYVVRIPNEDQNHFDKNSFSLAFWMKAKPSLLPPDNNTSSYLLCKGSISRNASTGATGKRFDIEFKNKQIRFALDDDNDAGGGGKDELQANGAPFFSDKWVHVVAIRDVENKRLRIYMNGALYATSTISRSNSGIGEASALILGNIGELEFLTTTNKPAPYKGMLDEVRMYNKVLSDMEIKGLATARNYQTITFAELPAKEIGDEDFALNATSSAGLPIEYSSSDTTVATVSNGKVHILKVGYTHIKAGQGGNDIYSPAPAITRMLTVNRKTQTVNFAALPQKVYGEPDFNLTATASSGLPVRYFSSDTTVAIIQGAAVHLMGPGSTIITAWQQGNETFADTSARQILIVVRDSIAPSLPVISSTSATDSSATLSWAPSTDFIGVKGYHIYQNGIKVYTGEGTSYQASGLHASKSYTFDVSAFDAAANESEKASVTITTPDTQAPTAPSALVFEKTTKHQVQLNWQVSTDNLGVIGYNIYRNGIQLNADLLTITRFNAERPIGNNVYNFTVKALDAAGNLSSVSNEVRVQNGHAGDRGSEISAWNADSPLTFTLNDDLTIYPNPSRGRFKVSLNSPEDGKVSITIINSGGSIIQSLSGNKIGLFEKEIELSNLPAGVYYVKTSLNKFSSSKAIVIN
ncbi:LamG-like jellyroll fold domain-containing protein [Desertivirga arenae]|uniref:LamG-like jellyroll fold domain-containing protein n=1 Tax=Desertivirga arenae TaxID=2810309 RepID=UPI001A97C631|nr:LamG-like jellyroll fold domain-containing protein [Pedobacter sp. SYSU D00823]